MKHTRKYSIQGTISTVTVPGSTHSSDNDNDDTWTPPLSTYVGTNAQGQTVYVNNYSHSTIGNTGSVTSGHWAKLAAGQLI